MTETSHTKTFNLSFDDLLDEAYSRVGGEQVTGRDALTARRSMNLLLIDLINRGVPLATMEEFSTTVTSSVGEYALDPSIMDVMYTVLARSSVEIAMGRISLYDFKAIPKKDQVGRPTQYTTHRDTSVVTMKIWPMPDNSTDVIKYWAVTKIEDSTRQDQYQDLPTRYLPALVSGLSYYLSLKLIPDNMQKIQMLKGEYEETLQRALEEDRERSTLRVIPALGRI